MTSFKFKINAWDKKSRQGVLLTPRGAIQTPCFIPVGTQASVKALSPQDLKVIGAQIVLANTYHLHLQPGEDTVEKLGGLSKFMGWQGPTMTDSGGYQVFSLGTAQLKHNQDKKKLSKFTRKEENTFIDTQIEKERMSKAAKQRIKPALIDEEGVTFFSHLDGSKKRFSPESSIRMQEKIGADLIVAFDDHESPLWNYSETRRSLERTNRWGLESLRALKRPDQLMYGVVHGGVYEDLRIASAKFTETNFPAIAIGGSYTDKETLYHVLDWTAPFFTPDKPRHLLGIGEIVDLFEAVARGIDFFDCVGPTRRGRHGNIYLSPKSGGRKENNFSLQLLSQKYAISTEPLDNECKCYTCQNFTRGYLHHLFKARELLGYHLTTYHNVYFITNLMSEIRCAIKEKRFSRLKSNWFSGNI